MRLLRKSNLPLKEKNGPDGSYFYGFRGYCAENKGLGALEIEEEDMQYKVRELEIYNKDTEEWEEAQMSYEMLKEI